MAKNRSNENDKRPFVTIIILSADDVRITFQCLEALFKRTYYSPLEVLVVDNGSDPEQGRKLTKEILKYKGSRIKILRNEKNLGYARANNQAALEASGELLVFLNNDVVVTPSWLPPLVSFMMKNRNNAACQPKLRSFVEREYFDYAGGAGGFLDMFGYPFTRGRVFDCIEKDVGQYDKPTEITWASGSCMVVRTDLFLEEHGFDEYFFSYMEEIDLCLRLKRKGYSIYCLPETCVYHYGAYTSNKDLGRKIFLNHRNNLYFIFKHYSIWPNFPLILIRLLFDIGSILHYLVEYHLGFVVAVFRAHLSLVIILPKLIREGVLTFKGRSLLVDDNIYKGSVVVSHFLLGRNNFDEVMGKGFRRQNYKRYVDVTYFREKTGELIPLPTNA